MELRHWISGFLLVNLVGCYSVTALPSEPTIFPGTAQPSRYVEYYVLTIGEEPPQTGSIEILSSGLFVAPATSEIALSPDAAANINRALEAMIGDERNKATAGKLTVAAVFFDEGHADIALQGEVFGAGDVVLIAIRVMILLTIFTDTAVQSATVTLNDGNIANLGVSWSGNARPDDYTYSREEIETFKSENPSGLP